MRNPRPTLAGLRFFVFGEEAGLSGFRGGLAAGDTYDA
jgi:hypothetical protein